MSRRSVKELMKLHHVIFNFCYISIILNSLIRDKIIIFPIVLFCRITYSSIMAKKNIFIQLNVFLIDIFLKDSLLIPN